MKKSLLFLALALFAVPFTGCEDKYDYVEVDYVFHENFVVSVENASGDNLLNLASAEGITIEYRDSIYFVDNSAEPNWGEKPPVFRVESMSDDDPTLVLKFGLFLPDDSYYHIFDIPQSEDFRQEFTIHWDDGTHDEIAFTYNVTWSWNKYPKERRYMHEATRHYEVWLNGEPQQTESLFAKIIE